jgi:hypothetical protein
MLLKVRNLLFLLLSFSAFHSEAQQISIRSGFLHDSVRLGDKIDYFLTARYPSTLTALFPDTTFSFVPFEFQKRNYFPTQTSQGESYDSAVYSLMTFDIADIQYLALPVYIIQASDCTQYLSQRDSVFLKSMIQGPVPDSIEAKDLPLLTNTVYQRVAYLFNYPILLIVFVTIIVVALIVWLAFGKRIRKYFKIQKLKKRNAEFQASFAILLKQVSEQFTPDKTEKALFLWKSYLETLERKPYTKLTTRETIILERDEKLGKSLHLLDQAIYGSNTSVLKPLDHLQQIAHYRFTKIIEEVTHG